MTPASPATATETTVLAPSYRFPIGLAIAALPIAGANVWVGLSLLAFGLFLGIQAATLRLHFTATALDIFRGATQIRSFPYCDWYHWEIYWSPVPILFYFREVNSIHFLPILFAPETLNQCLVQHCPTALNRQQS